MVAMYGVRVYREGKEGATGGLCEVRWWGCWCAVAGRRGGWATIVGRIVTYPGTDSFVFDRDGRSEGAER
jgi:hypothetical protein